MFVPANASSAKLRKEVRIISFQKYCYVFSNRSEKRKIAFRVIHMMSQNLDAQVHQTSCKKGER